MKEMAVLLVYIGANNNLVSDAYNSINAMEEGMVGLDADVYVYGTWQVLHLKFIKLLLTRARK
jgi:hypothetical protein